MSAFFCVAAAANLLWALIATIDWIVGNPPDKMDRWVGICASLCCASFAAASALGA